MKSKYLNRYAVHVDVFLSDKTNDIPAVICLLN